MPGCTPSNTPAGMRDAVQIASGQWVDRAYCPDPSTVLAFAAPTSGDPFGGQYLTAGNPYVAADGAQFASLDGNTQSNYVQQFGSTAAPQIWAESHNLELLQRGQAIRANDGVISVDLVRQLLQQHGYVGPSDLPALAQQYNLLKTPPPATPTPLAPSANPLAGLRSLPTPVLIGGGVVLLLVLGGGRIRL